MMDREKIIIEMIYNLIETEDEVYYFDKTHIKKSLGIKDVYVITRVL